MSTNMRLPVIACREMPENASIHVIYRLEPHNPDPAYFRERTDRNIGWITLPEQEMLKKCVVGIAGCGGMGGLLASIFVRLGVGEVRIADCENFDVSNINRQYAASRSSVGISKALETARLVRAISDDTTLVVYPQGITESTVQTFLEGCDIVCDEIEFWAIGSRILLHEHALRLDIPLINCSTVGFGTRLFLFDHRGQTIRRMLGFSLAEATVLQDKIQSRTASHEEILCVMERMLATLVPEAPEYGDPSTLYRSLESCTRRLREECRAPIIATNPPMASGFAADHTLLYLLQKKGVRRAIVTLPKTPGYLYFDAALMVAKVVTKEVSHDSTA